MMALPDRFTEPSGWRTGEFVNLHTQHKIHYGTIAPDQPKGAVVLLPGLSEFTEKYYETARDLLDRHFAVWVLDWAYQGRSSRFEDRPMRRHSDGFGADIHDLHKLIGDHVQPAAQGRPLIMLGHSMGGHLGLRYLAAHAGIFKAAAFSAPMLTFQPLAKIPGLFLPAVQTIMKIIGPRYAACSNQDWHEAMRKSDGSDIFSSDPLRDGIHNHWCKTYPELRIGGPTGRWVYEAIQSCRALPGELKTITVPIMMARAGNESIVDNKTIARAAALLPQARLVDLPGARHEILMERDAHRAVFFEAFDKLCASVDI